MEEKIIIAGFGGQGVLFAGLILAQTALEEGKEVTYFPSYGAEVRGGTANCTVIIADREIGAPVISYPTTLLALNPYSLDHFLPRLAKNGTLLINSSLVDKAKIKRKDIKLIAIPATEIADKLGNVCIANMVVLGCYLKRSGLLSFNHLEKVLAAALKKKPQLIELNQRAVKEGAEYK